MLLVAFWLSRLESPEPSWLLRVRQGRFLGEVARKEGGEFGYWPLDEVPARVAAATIAIEDRRFSLHPGVDPSRSCALSATTSSRAGVSGTSTLATQVARMQRPGRRSYARKSLEAASAFLMTLRHGRKGVLAHYLRIVPYGNRAHRIAYAARIYLDKPVEDLSWAEDRVPHCHPPGPRPREPLRPERQGARGRPGTGDPRPAPRGRGPLGRRSRSRPAADRAAPGAPGGRAPRGAVHAVLRLKERLHAEARRGRAAPPIVRTSIDLDVQGTAADAVLRAQRKWKAQGAGNAALVVLVRGTNQVRAWVGSAE